MASSFLLIGRGHGRDQNAAGLQDGEGSVLRLAADRVEHDINVGQYLLEPRLLHVNDPVRTKCLDVRDIVRERGGDHFMRNPPGQLHGVGADVPGCAMDEDSLRRVYRSVLEDHLPSGACDDWY